MTKRATLCVAMLKNKWHIFVVRFTVAYGEKLNAARVCKAVSLSRFA